MSLYTFCLSFLVVYCGSVLVVRLVVDYLIVVGFSYHFDYPHKSRDVFGFSFLVGVCHPIIFVNPSREMRRGFVRNRNTSNCLNLEVSQIQEGIVGEKNKRISKHDRTRFIYGCWNEFPPCILSSLECLGLVCCCAGHWAKLHSAWVREKTP